MKAASLAAVALALLVLPLRAQQERITDFTSEIEVQTSGDLLVAETISVIAAGDQINHGIYRDFPTLYRAYGLNRSVAFDVLEVLRDGQAEPWHTARKDNGVRVYIGDAAAIVPPGPHIYTLRYRTNHQLVMRPTFDEVYWNVTGNQWSFPIEHATARIRLPAGARVQEINAYTGAQGTQGRGWRALGAGGWNAVIETTAPLLAKEGFTVSLTWQKGLIASDANPAGLAEIVHDNQGIALSLAGMVAVLIYYLGAWVFIGRDPPRGVIIPLYQPPKGFAPAAVRYLRGLGTFDNKSFAAAVVHLAVAGALTIRERSKGSFILERKSPTPANLPPTEAALFSELLGVTNSLVLENSRHKTLQKARAVLAKGLEAETGKRFFARNSAWWLGGLLLSLIPAGIALLDSHNAGGALFMVIWLSIWSLGVLALLSTSVSAWKAGKFLTALPITLFSIPFLGGWVFGAWQLLHLTSPWIAGAFAFGFALNLLFCHLLKAPTIEGRRVMDAIEGFRQYLSVAEEDRLNLENPPERTPEHYEAFLPYALALDVEQQWSEQFSNVLAAAELQPDWYHGGSKGFASTTFATTMGSALSSAIASSSSAPGSSSGSGGGGSSGGGGGGGGGGGW